MDKKDNSIVLFHEKQVRRYWDEEKEIWYFSVVDIIEILTESPRPRKYWNALKTKLKAEGSELSQKVGQLKLESSDEKKYLTDVADTETLLRLIQSIPSKRAEPLKLWLAKVGYERIEETENPELAFDRAMWTYLQKGYSKEWINQRLKTVEVRKELIDEWGERGIKEGSSNLRLGDQITTYGYPAKFGTKITYTSGGFSGVDGNYLKTTAIIEYGNSGGGAYLKNGTFIGIPSAVMKGDLNSMGYILSVNKINSWLNGSSMAYNYNDNNKYARVSILEDIDLSTLDSLDLFISSEDASNETESGSQNVIKEEKGLITKVDNNLSKRVSGNILLQVEENGEGWYVYPDNKKKYYLGRPHDAFDIMRNFGLGIKHSELNSYLNSKFPNRLSGKIMLDVEQNGEAYYINPNDLKGYYLNRPADAFRIMREQGLGITNSDIRKIDVGEI